MSGFGAARNPPWAKAEVAPFGSLQQQVGALASPLLSQPGVATPTVYSLASTGNSLAQAQYNQQQQLALAQQQQVLAAQAQAAQAQAAQQQLNQVAAVSYPAPRVANPNTAHQQPKQRVFTGSVTKLHDNFGFVDEDVFFQTSCAKGNAPKVGDRVLVEASFNANMPFKWNATRIQVLPNQGGGGGGSAGQERSVSGPPQQKNTGMQNMPQPPPLMGQKTQPSTGSGRSSDRGYGRDRDRSERERERERERDRRERERQRERSPAPRRRSPRRSPSRSPAPASRSRKTGGATTTSSSVSGSSRRAAPRYMVQIPKISLDSRMANVITLKSRYQNLYIPSDFFNAIFTWTDAFPLHQPLSLGHLSAFHVLNKEVQALEKPEPAVVAEPSDADHLFSAKVMLLASPELDDLYHKSCALAEDPSDARDNAQHPARMLQFLVGLKGKNEPMAIGGPWSPSLDGNNPAEDPRVLINTAIRTTKYLTGIDLSNCTRWFRFAEVRYHRAEETHKGRLVPSRVETVVLFLPDVWSCMPSRLEWETLQAAYKKQLADKTSTEELRSTEEAQDEEDDGEGKDGDGQKKNPTHFSELDAKAMKVVDLRKELEARGVTSKGLKSQLIARLTKCMKGEEEKEAQEKEAQEIEAENKEEEPEKKSEDDERELERKRREEEDKKRKEERERIQRERRYTLPENEAIVVHPNPQAKSGKFDCSVMSLSVLLDYRPEDNKEHSFEVSLFAELFNEMLMRDFGFRVYKAMLAAPEPPPEKKKEKKDKDKKDDKERSKDEKEKEKSSKDSDKNKEEPAAKKRKTDDSEKSEDKKDGTSETSASQDKKDDKKEREDKRKDSKERDKDRDKSKKQEEKMVTEDRALLLAFSYFDQSHAGYVLDKDLEDILHTTGLHLSRAQIKKLIAKVSARDSVNYRKLTDRPEIKAAEPMVIVDEAPVAPAATDSAPAGDAAAAAATSAKEPTGATGLPPDEELASGNEEFRFIASDIADIEGNKKLLPSSADSVPSPIRARRSQDVPEGMVRYKGALLDVNSMMQKLERSERARADTDKKLKELNIEMEDLKSSLGSSEQSNQKVALELQELKKSLREQRKLTEDSLSDATKYRDILLLSRGTLTTMLVDVERVIGVKNEENVKVKREDLNGDDK